MNTVNVVRRKLNYHYIAILACSLIAHGLLLLNDGVYWDGWLIYHDLIEKDWNSLYSMFHESGGIPMSAYFHWLMGYFPLTVFGYSLVAFLSITFSGILVYLICINLELTSRRESLFIALLSLLYPAFQVSVELIMTPYLVYYCFFLLACYLAIRSEKTRGFTHYGLRFSALAFMVISFTIESLVVFYYGFLLLMVLYIRLKQTTSMKQVFLRWLPRHFDYVFLPLLYWAMIRVLLPSHGLYTEYNQIILSPLRLATYYYDFIKNAVFAQLDIALTTLWDYALFVFIALFIVLCIYTAFLRKSNLCYDKNVKSYGLLLFGLVLLALAIFPYAAVGKAASIHGWQTRHALLVALPMSVIIVAVIRLFFGERTGSFSKIGMFFFMILLLSFTLSSINNYLSWEARWVKDRSIMENLVTVENAEGTSVFWVDDQFPAGGEEYYRFYEWSSIFKSVWGNESRIGLDPRVYSPAFLTEGQRFFNEKYNLADFDPAGCQAILTIRHGPDSSGNLEMSTRYYFYKYFRRESLSEFLRGITQVQVQTSSAAEAVNCPDK